MGFGLVIGFTEHLQKITANTTTHWVTHSKDQCNYYSVLTSHCFVAASNGGHSPHSGFPNYHRPQLTASHSSKLQLSTHNFKFKVMLRRTVSRPVCLGISPHLGTKAKFLLLSVVVLFMWGALLTQGRDCPLKFLLALASGVILGSESWTTSPRYIAPAWTAQNTSLPLLRVLSLPGKQRVHRPVS
jgi:hypothetical protein